MKKLTREFVHSLPKAELHCHLDGSMRVETIIDLAKEQNVELPSTDVEELKRILEVGLNCKSLVEYLKPFDITCSVLQTSSALERATYELIEDCANENVRYLEIRFAPILHRDKGLRMIEIINAVMRGKDRGEKDFDIKIGIIICSIRHSDPSESMLAAELSVALKNRGVVGFDIAGAEKNFPVKDHIEAFFLIINNNINTTVHAGEAYGPESIDQALHYVNANRLGHGTRLRESGDLMNYVNDHRIPLEMCITSNIQTKAVKNFEDHPVRFYFDMGIRVTINTDNRMISNTTLTDELMLCVEKYGFNNKELARLIINGFKSAFLSYSEKNKIINSVVQELKDKGLIKGNLYL